MKFYDIYDIYLWYLWYLFYHILYDIFIFLNFQAYFLLRNSQDT